MQNPSALYRFETDADLTVPRPGVLVVALGAFIDAGQVQVKDFDDRSIVIIKGDGFFEPGSSIVAEKTKPLLARIQEGLKATPGSVLITGHTDNTPIRTLRYPSNWHLSQDRADAVKQLLAGTVKLYDGTAWLDAHPGDFAFVPEGGLHGFRNESGEPASLLILFAPGAPREAYFEGLVEIAEGRWKPTHEELVAFLEEHDNIYV